MGELYSQTVHVPFGGSTEGKICEREVFLSGSGKWKWIAEKGGGKHRRIHGQGVFAPPAHLATCQTTLPCSSVPLTPSAHRRDPPLGAHVSAAVLSSSKLGGGGGVSVEAQRESRRALA